MMHRKRTHGDRFRRLRALAGRTLLVAAVGLVGAGQVVQAVMTLGVFQELQ
ncbi:MAG: hypothetical protein VCC02_02915 [Myxococcota bacterium]